MSLWLLPPGRLKCTCIAFKDVIVIASSRKTVCSTHECILSCCFLPEDWCVQWRVIKKFSWLAIVFASSQKTEVNTCSDTLKDVLRLLLIPISSHDQVTLLWSALVGMLCIPLWLRPGYSLPGTASSLVSLKHLPITITSARLCSYNYQFVQDIEITLQVLEVSLVLNFVEIWPVYSRMCKKSTV